MNLNRLFVAVFVMLCMTPLAAQAPDGLRVRVDRSTSASDPDDTTQLKTIAAGKGFRVTGGPAGTFWNPAQTASGNFTARATFTLQKPSGHNNFYGLIAGGRNLDGPQQAYVYFVVSQEGTFLIRRREGDNVTDVKAYTPHASIQKPGANGQSVNALEVRVAGDTVSYVVNGTVVFSGPKAGLTTDGIIGVRVNHQLDVQVDGLDVQRQ